MNYEFHVGDYVEVVGGYIGWISNIGDDDCIYVTDKDDVTCTYHIPEETHYFKRIGAYDFTKAEKKKIEPIFRDGINEDMSFGGCLCMLKDKINELVDVMNELRDKEDAT